MVAVYADVEGRPADTPFARFLFDVMEQRGVSQRQLQAATGISASTIGDWVFKGVEPRAKTLRKLCPWLKMPFRDVWAIVEQGYAQGAAPYNAQYDDLLSAVDDLLARAQSVREGLLRARHQRPPED